MDKLFSGARPPRIGLNVHQPNSTPKTQALILGSKPTEINKKSV